MEDELSDAYEDLRDGSYDCVDRIVLNAYSRLGSSAGGFRHWWRRLRHGSEVHLDNAQLRRLAGRFSRRVRAFAKAHQIPVIDCRRGERKHELATAYLATPAVGRGLFLILVARAVAPVWEVERSNSGTIRRLTRKTQDVNPSSFPIMDPIMDPDWGHLTIKLAGPPPFGAQVLLTGHEDVAGQARKAGIDVPTEGNCFTHIAAVAALATVADPLSEPRTSGRLPQVCERWISSACLGFALDTEEPHQTGFRYESSSYQAAYRRNLLFRVGGQLEQVFQRLVDRPRARLAGPHVTTLFGATPRPRQRPRTRTPQLAVAVETPR